MRSRNTVTLERDSAIAFQVFLRLRTNRRPGSAYSFATLFERRRRLSSRNRVPDPFPWRVCYVLFHAAPSPLSFLLVRPARGKRERRFFHPARNAIRRSRKEAKYPSRSVSQLLGRRKTRWIRYVLFINAYDGWSFFLGKNRGSKGRTRCRDVSYQLLDSSLLVYRS